MLILDRSDEVHPQYLSFYDQHYPYDYTSSLRSGDAFPAVCYAHGIFDLDDREYPLREQFLMVESQKSISPESILEIGSGRGEVSIFMNQMGCDVFSVDCNPGVIALQSHTAQCVFDCDLDDRYVLGIGSILQFLDDLPRNLDTVIMVESLEHIFPYEWQIVWQRIKPLLQKNHGRLIITNVLFPVGSESDHTPEHVMHVDDVFFDALAVQSNKVCVRKKGNICLQF
jgi:SAM-dependent methyltransferase